MAVVYCHTHADHFGAVPGVVSEEDATSGQVQILGPVEFMEPAIAANV